MNLSIGSESISSEVTNRTKDTVEALKAQLQEENEVYLKDHPELRGMMSLFMARLLELKPESVKQFSYDFFTAHDLKEKVQKHMGEL